MFVLTMNRTGLRRLGVAALCGVVLTGTVMVVNRHLEKADAAPTAAESTGERIATTQDIGAYFSARGLEVDLSTAAVDEVKVPRRWDEDFKAFDEVVKQSGQGLKKYRGKAVEKWTAACPARSTGENTCQAVLLVYKKKPVGAYLRTEPGGEVLGLKNKEYVKAARTIGTSGGMIMMRHILPNILPTFIVVSTLSVASSILIEASLSFLGLGIQPPAVSWGVMLSDGRNYLATNWWMATFPGIAISVTVLGIMLLGNWLRDVLDPKNQGLR